MYKPLVIFCLVGIYIPVPTTPMHTKAKSLGHFNFYISDPITPYIKYYTVQPKVLLDKLELYRAHTRVQHLASG